jgi:hypothetical protein
MHLATVAVALAVQSAPARPDLDRAIEDVRCRAAVQDALNEWRARSDVIYADAPEADGTRTLRAPTDTVGTWVTLALPPSGNVSVHRVTASVVERRRFDSDCNVAISRVERAVNPGAWTDADLAARLGRGDAGVILLWSPHMPLSIDMHAELVAVTRDLGLSLVTLLDPGADATYAASAARERALPESALRPLGGIELAFRGLTVHAPSLQVFMKGRLVGPVLPGYRDGPTLRLAIERVLSGLDR